MIRLEMKNYNNVSTEKQEKHRHNHQVKLINMNILQRKKYYLLTKSNDRILHEINDRNLHILLQEKLWKNKQRNKFMH